MPKASATRCRIAIFASGSGTNAEEIINSCQNSTWGKVNLIITNNSEAGVIARAKRHNISLEVISKEVAKDGNILNSILKNFQIDVVVLAGYLKKIPVETVRNFRRRIINIHPALLPNYGGKGMYGMRVHEAVLKNKEEYSGITIHHVTEEYDEGAPILQEKLKIEKDWTAANLASHIHQLEYTHFPKVVENICRDLIKASEKKMSTKKKINSALISVYHKEGLEKIAKTMISLGTKIYSTGGTADYLRGLGATVHEVADMTDYPSIFDGRVKTLHPKVFGGILARRDAENHQADAAKYDIPFIDVVIVDLYPFEATVASGAEEAKVIEKIDIGGISLIRAAAKNYRDVAIVPSQEYYNEFAQMLSEGNGELNLEQRKKLAVAAFDISSHYDSQIYRYMAGDLQESFKDSVRHGKSLRYGENPHQTAEYFGDLDGILKKLNGKELSYNNLVDADAAVQVIAEFDGKAPTFAIFKHTNPCGLATGNTIYEAWTRALECDPLSAFGGILICNGEIDAQTAKEIDEIFYELVIADSYSDEALKILSSKKNRRVLIRTDKNLPEKAYRSLLNGVIRQDRDQLQPDPTTFEYKSSRKPEKSELEDAIFGVKAVKHLKSNAIAIVKNGQLIGSGMGQTSRVDALKQAIQKAKERGFKVNGAILASDAFFPFKDCAEIAHAEGIDVIIEPGGSVKDQETIDYCESQGLCLIFNHIRHFKH